jgi:hypothetical protein
MLTPQRAVQTLYILVGEYLLGGVDPLAASADVSCGAAGSFLAAAVVVGGRGLLGATPAAYAAAVAMAVVGTALAIAAFLAGMARVGSAGRRSRRRSSRCSPSPWARPCSGIGSVRARWSAGWRWSPERCCCPCSAGPGRR